MSIRTSLLQTGYEKAIRPVLFTRDPEEIHNRTLNFLGTLCSNSLGQSALRLLTHVHSEPTTVAGIEFLSSVGLAAGMDKNGEAVMAWEPFGFGFAELGTVTAAPREGNPRQRMWRFPKREAVINYMGFNNNSSATLAETLSGHGIARGNLAVGIPLGISIGSVATEPEAAIAEYQTLIETLSPYADYFAFNSSCPNVEHTDSDRTEEIISEIVKKNRALAPTGMDPAPIFWKISPDLDNNQLEKVLEVTEAQHLAGIIACNTSTKMREKMFPEHKVGGLSGRSLLPRTKEIVGFLRQRDDKIPIIASGGITRADDARELINHYGANLVQMLTGLVFHGPALVRAINEMKLSR